MNNESIYINSKEIKNKTIKKKCCDCGADYREYIGPYGFCTKVAYSTALNVPTMKDGI